MKEIAIKILNSLSGKLEGFYLAGGTALSVFYFNHRESYDLDFFTRDFSAERIKKVVTLIADAFDFKIALKAKQDKKDFVRIFVYTLKIDKQVYLKIDFVEDVYKLISPPKLIDGVPVLSKEDIYLRKIFAACGSSPQIDEVGKKRFSGGRQEAKDFFDLYVLSTVFMPLSKFAATYCPPEQIESIVTWFGAYNRMEIKLGLNDIVTDKAFDFHQMERHFKKEIEQLIRRKL